MVERSNTLVYLITSFALELKVEGSNPSHPEMFFSFRNAEIRTILDFCFLGATRSRHVIPQGDGWFESRYTVFKKELMNNLKLFGMKKRVVPKLTMSKYTIRW